MLKEELKDLVNEFVSYCKLLDNERYRSCDEIKLSFENFMLWLNENTWYMK